MSKYIEIPMRPANQSWPGMGTRVGFLDPGHGYLEDGSINNMINRGDVLAKRKGFVRGLDEHFSGVVCGLFKYTSTCGIESLLVADEGGINIRQPFAVPLFENSDAYPFDSFSEDGFPNSYYWRNIERYVAANDVLGMRAGVAQVIDPMATTDIMRWFKDATNLSYQVRVEYQFDATITTQQQIAIVIKGNGDLTSGSYLLGQVTFTLGTYTFQLYKFNGVTLTQIDNSGLDGSLTAPAGFLTLSYDRDVPTSTFTAKLTALPFAGTQKSMSGTLTTVEDANLGQVSGIGMGHTGTPQPNPGILVVDGGPI